MSLNHNEDQELNQEDKENNKINPEKPFRNFKGIWIDADIWLHSNLNIIQKTLYAEIVSLEGENGCFASNEYFMKFFNCSKESIQKALQKLKKEELIWIDKFDGRTRWIKTIHGRGVKKYTPAVEKNTPLPTPSLIYTYNKEDNKDKSKTVDKSTLGSKDPHICSIYLFEKLKGLRPDRKEPNWKQWDKDFELMLRRDKIKKEDIIKAIDFVFREDNTFKVESPSSLRNKYENIADHIEIQKKTTKPLIASIAQTPEGIIIKKIHAVYLNKYRPRQTGKFQENCLELMNGFLIDRKRNYKAKATLPTLIDQLKSEHYTNPEGFQNCLSIELKEALTVWKCSNAAQISPIFQKMTSDITKINKCLK